MVIDLPSDTGLTHFHSLSRILNLPEFVKQADFTRQVETKELPDEAFADPEDRKFPIHTKAAAYLSFAYFTQQRDAMEKRADHRCHIGFARAQEWWGLHEDYLNIEKALTKQAEPIEKESKFALEVGEEKFFPINTPHEILKSADSLIDHREQLDYPLRSDAAKNIMKAAAATGLPLSVVPEDVHKMAGCGLTTKRAAMEELTQRWNNETRPSLAEPLHTCLTALQGLESGILGGEVCEKIAAVIDRYDRLVGKPSFPEEILFAFTKHAADKMAGSIATLPDGTSYHLADLKNAEDAFGVLGQDVVKDLKHLDGTLSLSKVSELIETLPRIDGDILKEAFTTKGIKPYTQDKHAMVAQAVAPLRYAGQGNQAIYPFPRREKRSNVLADLEAKDPLVKRALDVVRRLKAAESEEEDEDNGKEKSPQPRGIGGLFIKKAPNSTESKPCK